MFQAPRSDVLPLSRREGGDRGRRAATPCEGLDALDAAERHLLNDFQHGFPLEPRPFRAIGQRLGLTEDGVLDRLSALRDRGYVRRVGPVFRARRVGSSTLAAMQVPESEVARVAALINARPEVNHNYLREHPINLWFVVTAAGRADVDAVLRDLARSAGHPVLDLPLVTAYHIDLGFDLLGGGDRRGVAPPAPAEPPAPSPLEPGDRALLGAAQDGLGLLPRPYAALGRTLGLPESRVIDRLGALLASGHVKRLGVVVDHAALGYTANAMVVLDLPDDRVDAAGRALAGHRAVTLCYRRPRRPPAWRYNLFCMIHGRDRDAVRATLDRILAEEGLDGVPCEALFSVFRFKQRGARYVHGDAHAR